MEGEILLQKFDKEWQEFIDLEGNAVVEDKAKLRIISQVCNILQELNSQLFLKLICKAVEWCNKLLVCAYHLFERT